MNPRPLNMQYHCLIKMCPIGGHSIIKFPSVEIEGVSNDTMGKRTKENAHDIFLRREMQLYRVMFTA